MNDELNRLVESEWHCAYDERLTRLWHESVRLNAYLFLLARVYRFPTELFALNQRHFWGLIGLALYESSILLISRLLADRSRHAYTLVKFKEDLLKHARNAEARAALAERLEQADFTESVESTIERVKEVRDKWLAHLARQAIAEASDPNEGMTLLPLAPLEEIRDSINCLIDALTLDGGRAHIYAEYSKKVYSPPHLDARPDIDKILELIVANSDVIELPEKQPDYWQRMWSTLTDHQRLEFNRYRERLGRPPYSG